MAQDALVDSLTLDTIDTHTRTLWDMEDGEEENRVLNGIARRISDDGTSFYVLLEKIKDDFLQKNRHVDLLMVSLPLADLNKIAQDFGLDGFADDFVRRLHQELTLRKVEAAILGGRLLVKDQNPKWVEVVLAPLIDQLRGETMIAYSDSPSLTSEQHAALKPAVDKLHFYSSHVHLYLGGSSKDSSFVDSDNPKQIWDDLETQRPHISEFPETSKGRKDFAIKNNKFLAKRRALIATSISYFLKKEDDLKTRPLKSSYRQKGRPLGRFFSR